jgi:hypothetical protein
VSGGGGGGRADAQTSLNNAQQSWGQEPKRWGPRQWLLLLLALAPVIVIAVWGALT